MHTNPITKSFFKKKTSDTGKVHKIVISILKCPPLLLHSPQHHQTKQYTLKGAFPNLVCLVLLFRSYGVVSEVWVCRRTLAAESHRTCSWLCAMLSRMFQFVPRLRSDGWQCNEKIYHFTDWSFPSPYVWPRWRHVLP